MKININKKEITELLESSGFMVGVNKGFHESPLPTFAVKSYSDLGTLKPKYRKDDIAIAQDLGLRMGTQALTKLTLGGLVYGAARGAQSLAQDNGFDIDIDSDSSKLAAAVPAIATAWYTSDKANKYLPNLHKKVIGEKDSIYK